LPPVYFVPLADWEKRMSAVTGIGWKSGDEQAILAKAKGLGWKPAGEETVSPAPAPPIVSMPSQTAHLAQQFN